MQLININKPVDRRRLLAIIAALSSFTLLARFFRSLRSNYLRWKALGKGGVPYNAFGWLMQWLFFIAKGRGDTTSLECYGEPWGDMPEEQRERNRHRFLEDLPQRKDFKSYAAPFTIPQRQLNAGFVPPMLRSQRLLFDTLVAANQGLVTVGTSRLELYDQAMQLPPSIPTPVIAVKSRGEICHIHGSDGSCHVSLSYADAKEVISKGWGERHRLSGTYVNLGYTFMYVPRDEEEVEIMGQIFKAGIGFMTGGKEVSGVH